MVIIFTFTFEKWSLFGHYSVKIWSFFGHFLGVNFVIILRLRHFRHCIWPHNKMLRAGYAKIYFWTSTLFLSVLGWCVPNFRTIALKLWPVASGHTDGRTDGHTEDVQRKPGRNQNSSPSSYLVSKHYRFVNSTG